jgi:phosphate transport system protein
MTKHFQRELKRIKKMILSLGASVEERVRMASQAMEDWDIELASQIISTDHEIDKMEVEIEEECLKILALHQPVAVDLRFIVAVIKINNDLERIGDQAVNIAQRIETISEYNQYKETYFDYFDMAAKAEKMLKMSLDALVNMDIDLAFNVLKFDNEVDAIQKEAYDRIKIAIEKEPQRVELLINLLLISRHIERLADHTTNIAEEVIYLIEGEIIRHGNILETE